jgi:hypothetical protein
MRKTLSVAALALAAMSGAASATEYGPRDWYASYYGGDYNRAYTNQTGKYNYTVSDQNGDGNKAQTSQYGLANIVGNYQNGWENAALNIQAGKLNLATNWQEGYRNIAVVSQIGNYNASTIGQWGAHNVAGHFQSGLNAFTSHRFHGVFEAPRIDPRPNHYVPVLNPISYTRGAHLPGGTVVVPR